MQNIDATFLEKDQLEGPNALGIMKQFGPGARPTDLAVILGAVRQSKQKNSLCAYYLSSAVAGGSVAVVHPSGNCDWLSPRDRSIAARPALPPSVTSNIRPRNARTTVEFGTWPQTVVSEPVFQLLELQLLRGVLNVTGREFLFDSVDFDYRRSYTPYAAVEYKCDGERFVRVMGNPADSDSILSDGTVVQEGRPYWVRVEPIKWLCDPSGWWVAEQCLYAGVQFDEHEKYDGKFANTFAKKYLRDSFIPQMIFGMNKGIEQAQAQEPVSQGPRSGGFGVKIVETPMSVRDQIDFYVKNHKSFMLHGPSGVGKTARVEAIDPNLTAVPLWNGVLPEDIVGKVIYPSGVTAPVMTPRADGEDASTQATPIAAGGVWVPPAWYTELCDKCAAEPNKNHVLFIDEVTNARPPTQSLIFHTVLKGSISPSVGTLPKNAVVVLAGNEAKDSGAAYNMPSPLFRRMSGHVYLKADLADWLTWGSGKSAVAGRRGNPDRRRVHPLISMFLASNPAAFYSAWDEENPAPFAVDPRGWVQVSDIIYDNDNVLRRELLENKIGTEYTAALMAFAGRQWLSLDDVINNQYTSWDIPESSMLKLALGLSFRHVDARHLGVVREFIGKYLGAEVLATFDSQWAGNDDERALQIAQLNQKVK